MSTQAVQQLVQNQGYRKDRKDWISGNQPATLGQLSFLTTLAERVGERLDIGLVRTKAQASDLIEQLLKKTDPEMAKTSASAHPKNVTSEDLHSLAPESFPSAEELREMERQAEA